MLHEQGLVLAQTLAQGRHQAATAASATTTGTDETRATTGSAGHTLPELNDPKAGQEARTGDIHAIIHVIHATDRSTTEDICGTRQDRSHEAGRTRK